MTVDISMENNNNIDDAKTDVDVSDVPTPTVRGYQLKAVVKDTQAGSAIDASYCRCRTDPVCDNLLAVLTEKMLTVYDDFHMGDHVCVVAQYVHPTGTDDASPQSRLVAMTWLPGAMDSEMHRYSPRVALVMSDGSVAVVSIVDSMITSVIQTNASVVAIEAPSSWDGCVGEYVALLDEDGIVSLWDIASGVCVVSSVGSEKVSMAFSEGGEFLLVANRHGGVVEKVDISTMVRMQENEMGRSVQEIALDHGGAVKKMVRLPNKNNNSNAFVVVTESCFQVWKDVSTTIAADGGPAMGSPWALKGYKDQSCRPFACNGSVAILGTDDGDGHIFNVETGEEESILSVVRVVSEIEAAAVSADGSHIVLAAGNGFLFRFLLK
jgi:hypothetical protein